MKTKIIYISGSEIFNMSDVRDAFDTVRRELGLSKDTILFGVPVDAEDALGGQFESVQETVAENIPVVDEVQPETAEPVEEVVKPEKPKRTKKKTVVAEETPVEEKIEPVVAVEKEPEKEVIPILSVLGGDTKPETIDTPLETDNTIQDIIPEPIKDTTEAETVVDIAVVSNSISDTDDDFVIKPDDGFVDDDIPTIETETTTIQDSDEDNALEKLLESVKSLHEDKDEPELQVIENTPDETDATLEKLATEFAENQDKIVNTTKSTARGGRIGKLKNILPFKKSKRNDSGIMGDLFGWAGVAANDEEFAIPEFFPTAVKK